ncbi:MULTISPECIES: hypothetical protein [Streptococcus]|uniref:Uncharacterized protein n=1 Tax=Streptococcus downei MFe28 TaxID=764290 RepID=A0A380JIK2_STRDO|nr:MULTISPECIES: hypothetical protein [Streptococcus]SUN37206.1 Uncharacterised protein [Streptococcus downei MFe28]
MSNKETAMRNMILQQIMTSMRINLDKAKKQLAELESFGLIKFDSDGNFYLKVLED